MLTVYRIAVAVVLSFLSVYFSPQTFGRQETGTVKFSFRSIDGGNVTDADVRGKVVVFISSASWLPVSRRRAAVVRRLADEFTPQGVVFYLISTDSESPRSKNYASDERLREVARKRGLPFPILRDPKGKTLRKYGRDQIPLIVVLDKQGRVDGKPLEGFGPEGALDRTLGSQLMRLTQ
jgi:peroxiredoxin